MFFEPQKVGMRPPPFTHSVFTSLVVPRPIGWISTISTDGVINLAPYSFFNALTTDPPLVMYCPGGFKSGTEEPKDSLVNAQETGEFVFNLCSEELAEPMNLTSAHVPASIDEMVEAGLEAAPSVLVKAPRVAAAPVALECLVEQIVELPAQQRGGPNHAVIGRVVGIHIDDEVIVDGAIDVRRVRPLARLGYMEYATIDPGRIFVMNRPYETR